MRNCPARYRERPSPALPSLPEPNQPRFPALMSCASMNISTTSDTRRYRTSVRSDPLPGLRLMGGPQLAPA